MKKYLQYILLLLFALPSIVSIFHSGFFQTDDGNWIIIRFASFFDSFRDGQIPVRLLSQSNHGYGYPVSNFLYPLYLYLGVPFKLLGLSYVTVIKLLFALCMLSSAIGMYVYLRTYFAKYASFVGSLVFLYAPYHLYDLTVRGSLGELLALGIAPFLLFSLKKNNLLFSSILTAALITSHNSLALVLLPVIFLITSIDTNEKIKEKLKPLIFGIGISSFFWMVALYELPLTIFKQTNISNVGDYFAPLDLIGIPILIIFIWSGVLWIKDKKSDILPLCIFFIGIISLLMSSSLSQIVWNYLPGQFIQFPFRLLSVTIICAGFLAAYSLSNRSFKFFFGIILVLLLFLTNNYFYPRGYDFYVEGFYSTNQATTTVKNEYMPLWVKEQPTEYSPQVWDAESGTIRDQVISSNKIILLADLPKEQKVFIKRIYYPGWKAYVNGNPADISYQNPKGIMEVLLPKGRSTVEMRFTETPFRLAADAVSIGSFAALLFVTYRKRKS